MTNEEIAGKLRYVAEYNLSHEHLRDLADELDPPKPKPGTLVWWRRRESQWRLGTAIRGGIVPSDNQSSFWSWGVRGLEYKPARILEADEVAVKVPPVIKWPEGMTDLIMLFKGETMAQHYRTIITRSDAERMEATE